MHLLFEPFVCLINIYLLASLVGFTVIYGFLAMLVFVLLQLFTARCISNLRKKASALTDTRLKLLSDTVSGIRSVKAYGWELLLKVSPFSFFRSALMSSEIEKPQSIWPYLSLSQLPTLYSATPVTSPCSLLSVSRLHSERRCKLVPSSQYSLLSTSFPFSSLCSWAMELLPLLKLKLRSIALPKSSFYLRKGIAPLRAPCKSRNQRLMMTIVLMARSSISLFPLRMLRSLG